MRRKRSRVSAGDTAGGQGRDPVVGWVTLILGIVTTGFLSYYNRQPRDFEQYYLVNLALLLWVPLVFILVFLRREVADFGMTTGDLRSGLLVALLLFLLFIPVIVIVAPTAPFQTYYVAHLRNSGVLDYRGQIDPGRAVFHETVLGFYMFAWEWYFRGFLLFGLKRLMPSIWAALLQAAAFALLHYLKPPIEVASSFFGALLLAGVALRYRSFLPCFFVHWAISASFDATVLYHHLHRR